MHSSVYLFAAALLIFSSLTTNFIVVAEQAVYIPEQQPVDGSQMKTTDDGVQILEEKRIPHPAWRKNARINHIQHAVFPDFSPGRSYSRFAGDYASRPLFMRYVRRWPNARAFLRDTRDVDQDLEPTRFGLNNP
ncbi:hypothetical protein Ddc_13676 [Ditylenchus destructor]|nr:hypothetical protein Ddc_13676 [Ditylenchus destructor]